MDGPTNREDRYLGCLLGLAAGDAVGTAVEFKPGAPRTSSEVFARVVRAALALANSKDGGWIILGIEERDKKPQLIGLQAADLASWNYDDVSAALNGFAIRRV